MDAVSSNLLRRLGRGTASARELAELSGLSQPTLSRRLTALRAQVLPMGAARARRYGLLATVRDLGSGIPIYRVNRVGEAIRLGTLHSLAAGEFWFESALGDREATRLYSDLPWWVHDLRPQGFLGRLFPRRYPELQLPDDVRRWDAATMLYALCRRGDDLLGDFLLGEVAYSRRWEIRRDPDSAQIWLEDEHRPTIYPQFAREAMQGQPAGSSAAGEQAKFLVRLRRGASCRDVLVKFSPPVTEAIGRRWADLLRAEHLALTTLNEAGIATAHSEWMECGGRAFLEVERFDRVGLHGRRSLISLEAVDAEFVGLGGAWPAIARALVAGQKLAPEDGARIDRIAAFGHLIANTDMHNGNLGLHHDDPARPGYGQFVLAPVYDMLPMLYVPRAGEVLAPRFAPPAPLSGLESAYREMLPLAQDFWQRLANDARVSSGFRAIADENHLELRRLAERLG
jgi:DNA-binding transcriptional ArsR family regulator